MTDSGIKTFACDTIDKAVIRTEWGKWVRSLELYLASEEITDVVKRETTLAFRRNRATGGSLYIPGAVVTVTEGGD